MIKIPTPPDKDNRDEIILEAVVDRINSILNDEKGYWVGRRSVCYEGVISWRVICELKSAGYFVMPQHGCNIPANDWKDHVDSIYNWHIAW